MMLKVVFTAGSLKGTSASLACGTEVSMGRSRSCSMRPLEDDVSGHHIVLSAGADGEVRMKVLSRHDTFHNSSKVRSGDVVPVKVGDCVRMGATCEFRIEDETDLSEDRPTELDAAGCEPATQIDTSSGFLSISQIGREQKTVPTLKAFQAGAADTRTGMGATFATRIAEGVTQGDAPSQTGGETALLGTLVGSEEDMQRIKREYQIRRRNRTLAWVIPVVAAFSAVLATYIVLRPVPEERVSWPKDDSGKFLNHYSLIEPYIAVRVPKVPALSESKEGSVFHIKSALGRDRDVPLDVYVTVTSDKKILRMGHSESFQHELALRREMDITFTPGDNAVRTFIGKSAGAGVPVSYVDYTRRNGADEFFGYLLFLRHAEKAYAFSIEVPLSSRWRTEEFLRMCLTSMVLYAPKRVPEHWEGSNNVSADSLAANDLSTAKKNIMLSTSPQKWEKGFYYLLSALIKGTESGDKEIVANATEILVILRARQREWYNTSKLSYLKASVVKDKGKMSSIQSTSEAAFTSAFRDSDCRYESIKRKEWR